MNEEDEIYISIFKNDGYCAYSTYNYDGVIVSSDMTKESCLETDISAPIVTFGSNGGDFSEAETLVTAVDPGNALNSLSYIWSESEIAPET